MHMIVTCMYCVLYGSPVYACTCYVYIYCSLACAGTRGRIKKAPSFVVELGSDNFNSVVMDPTKNVLVEFYAPCNALFTASVGGKLVWILVQTPLHIVTWFKRRWSPHCNCGMAVCGCLRWESNQWHSVFLSY